MASIFNHSDFWYMSGDVAANKVLKHQGERFITFSWIQGIILCVIAPLIIFSNGFVVYAVWKDPLKNLRSAPLNYILQSMAVADLLIGVILSPVNAYWLFALAVAEKVVFSFHAIYSLASTFVGASFAHVMLLSIDRLCAVVIPLKYKAIVTRRRINLAITVLWIYFISFGIAAFVFKNSFFVIGLALGVHLVVFYTVTLFLYMLMLYRLRKNSKLWKQRILHTSIRVSQQIYIDKEMRFATAMAVAIVVSLFIVTPFIVLIGLVYFCVPCYSYPQMLLVSTGLEITFSYLKSIVKPLFFCWRLPKYRQAWQRCVETTCKCRSRVKTSYRESENYTFDTKL